MNRLGLMYEPIGYDRVRMRVREGGRTRSGVRDSDTLSLPSFVRLLLSERIASRRAAPVLTSPAGVTVELQPTDSVRLTDTANGRVMTVRLGMYIRATADLAGPGEANLRYRIRPSQGRVILDGHGMQGTHAGRETEVTLPIDRTSLLVLMPIRESNRPVPGPSPPF